LIYLFIIFELLISVVIAVSDGLATRIDSSSILGSVGR